MAGISRRTFLGFAGVWLLGATQLKAAAHSIPGEQSQNSDADARQAAEVGLAGMTVHDLLKQSLEQERKKLAWAQEHAPFVEVYIQTFNQKKKDDLPTADDYFLGQFHVERRRFVSMERRMSRSAFGFSFTVEGILEDLFADPETIVADDYEVRYSRAVRDGDLRAIRMDIKRAHSHKVGFEGSVLVEDETFNIINYDGQFHPNQRLSIKGNEYYFAFDTQCANVAPGLWAPVSVYLSDPGRGPMAAPRFEALVRVRYTAANKPPLMEESSETAVAAPNDGSKPHDRSPIEQRRLFEAEGETGILQKMERANLIAPRGEVERTLETIVQNLMVSNGISEAEKTRCRVLTTYPLEIFGVERTIVVSRSVIDTVPNESTLALILATELLHLPHPDDAEHYNFGDMLRFDAVKILKRLASLRDTEVRIPPDFAGALELVKNSPYADGLAGAQLYFRQLEEREHALRNLLRPLLGRDIRFPGDLWPKHPQPEPSEASQHAALALGSRLTEDPVTHQLSFLHAEKIASLMPWESKPFGLTPPMRHFRRRTDWPKLAEPPLSDD